MSKTQIRKQAAEVREVLRYAKEALTGPHPDPHDRIAAGLGWIDSAIEDVRKLEVMALQPIQSAERRS